jgi:hypothetical protein
MKCRPDLALVEARNDGRSGASCDAPAAEAERRLSVRSTDLRWSVRRRRPRAESSPSWVLRVARSMGARNPSQRSFGLVN